MNGSKWWLLWPLWIDKIAFSWLKHIPFFSNWNHRTVPPLPIGQAPNQPRSTDPGTTRTPILHIIKVHFAAMTILWFLRWNRCSDTVIFSSDSKPLIIADQNKHYIAIKVVQMSSMQASDREIPPLWLMLRQLSTTSRTRRNATGKWEESQETRPARLPK